MSATQPGPGQRWRCGSCGNLTRFDVVRSTRAQEFVHVSLTGEPTVEERELLADVVESVSCRWCGSRDAVTVEALPDAGTGVDPAPAS